VNRHDTDAPPGGRLDIAPESDPDVDVFPPPDAVRVALVGTERLAATAAALSETHGMTVSLLDDEAIPDGLLVGGAVPDAVVVADPSVAAAVRGVLDRPVVVYADLDDDVTETVAAADGRDLVSRESDTDACDLLAARVRDRASARRREAELSLRSAAMDQADVGITIADVRHEDDVLVYANRGFTEITGYDRSAVLSRNCRFLQGAETDEAAVAEIRAALDAEDPVSVDILNYRADGERFWNQLDLTPVEEHGEVTHYFGFQKDVTERKRLEERLERENERLSTFASVVSHDLRNPLAVADGALDAVRDRDLGPEAAADIERAEDALDRMDDLIGDVLTLARQGAVVDDPERTSLSTVASQAWSTVDAPGAALELGDDLGVVLADPERLRTVFENLFRNSVEHGSTDSRAKPDDAVEHAGPTVTVEVGTITDGFYVADDGPGIPESDREAVFDQGFTTNDGGTGIGLTTVESIATAHGWTVSVDESRDGGARFVFADVEAP